MLSQAFRARIGFASTLFFLAFVLVAWTLSPYAQERYGGTLTIAIRDDDAIRMDGRKLKPSHETGALVFDSLVAYGRAGMQEIVPSLAKSWEQPDPLTYIFQIRKGVKFHNGRELTAEDIKTNYDWVLQTPKGWRPITHRDFLVRVLSKVEAVDRYTVKMTLKTPFEPFLKVLHYVWLGIIPPEEVEKWGKDFNLHPVGTGPFKVTEIVPGNRIVVERFEDYWGPRPYLDKVVIRIIPDNETRLIALQTGELDLARYLSETAVPILNKDPRFKIHKFLTGRMENRFHFNLRRWPMSSLKFRKAVALGAPWTKIADLASPLKGTKVKRTLLEGSWAEDPTAKRLVPSYNPGEAKKLIAEVEAEAGRKIPTLYLISGRSEWDASVGEMVKTELKKIGVELNYEVLEMGRLIDTFMIDKKIPWDMAIIPGAGSDIDPYMAIDYFHSEGSMPDGKNRPGYVNPRIDALLGKAAASKSREEQAKFYQEAERLIFSELPLLNLFNIPFYVGVNAKVHDYVPHNWETIYITNSWTNVWKEKK